MSEWQPITVEQKNGDFLLVCAPGWKKATVGRWHIDWWRGEDAEPFYSDEEPTLWLPLPAPPQPGGEP